MDRMVESARVRASVGSLLALSLARSSTTHASTCDARSFASGSAPSLLGMMCDPARFAYRPLVVSLRSDAVSVEVIHSRVNVATVTLRSRAG